MIKDHVGGEIAGYISRDSTAIEAREKPVKKNNARSNYPRERGDVLVKESRFLPRHRRDWIFNGKGAWRRAWKIYRINVMWDQKEQ